MENVKRWKRLRETIYQIYHLIFTLLISFLLTYFYRILIVLFVLIIFLTMGFFSINNVWVSDLENYFLDESFQHPFHSLYNKFFNGYDNSTLEVILSVPPTDSLTNILREDILSVVSEFHHVIQQTFLKYDEIPIEFKKHVETFSSTFVNTTVFQFHPFCSPNFKSRQCLRTNEGFLEMLLKTKFFYSKNDSFSHHLVQLPLVNDFIVLKEENNFFFFSMFASLYGIKKKTCQPHYNKNMMELIEKTTMTQNVLTSLETKLKFSEKKKPFFCIYNAKAIRFTYSLQSHQNVLNHLWFRKLLSLLGNTSTFGPLQLDLKGLTNSKDWIFSLYYDMIFICSLFCFTLVFSSCIDYFCLEGIYQQQRIFISFLGVALPLLSILSGFGLCIWLKCTLFPTSILSAFLILFLSLHHTMTVHDTVSSFNETNATDSNIYHNLIQDSVQNHFVKTFHLTLLLLSLSWKATPIIKSFCFYFLAGSLMNFFFFTILFLPFLVIQIKQLQQHCNSHVTRKDTLPLCFFSYFKIVYVKILILTMVIALLIFLIYNGQRNFQIDFHKESMSYNSNLHLVKKNIKNSYFPLTTETTNIMFLGYPTVSWWTQNFRDFVNHLHQAFLDFNVACSIENPLSIISNDVKYKTWMTSGQRSIILDGVILI
ncbi:uncharacterized protein LOC128883278 isoform X1 [Hylaeus volcanicus]|uniref:uncharacterized protein LOC128883278 isoform X1 n=1 Tax=Hylaeus volcanicus TaxID=313075 RepID=UPI0023B83F9B|nr:uncharacterized protein LOC128883278 isoform X1 [Hylaeus volcanicus]